MREAPSVPNNESDASCQILEIPPEIWEQVAAVSGRQAIARLCAASRAFHSLFASLLYSTATTKPPLTPAQSNLLIRTLSEAHTSWRKPHPVQVVKSFSFAMAWDSQQCCDALRNLFEVTSGQLIRGAALRTLEWNSPETDELKTLLTPGYFPNLKELSVSWAFSDQTNFDVSAFIFTTMLS
jgi:hypothetical protein